MTAEFKKRKQYSEDPLAPWEWFPWVPGNPSIFEHWVLEPINFGMKGLKFVFSSVETKQEMGIGSMGTSIRI